MISLSSYTIASDNYNIIELLFLFFNVDPSLILLQIK